MTAGTRILLLAATLFVGTLVLYYGYFMSPPVATHVTEVPTPHGSPDTANAESGDVVDDRSLDPAPTTSRQRQVMPAPHGTSSSRRAERPSRTLERTDSSRPVIEMGEALPQPLANDVQARRDAQQKPSAPEANTPALPPDRTWTVRSGDSLSSIAAKALGDSQRWGEIVALNPGLRPERLQIGQVLALPSRSGTAAAPSANAPVTTRIHVVASGDSLSSIAKRYTGSEARWEEIFDLNRKLLGNNPDALQIGMELTVPAARD